MLTGLFVALAFAPWAWGAYAIRDELVITPRRWRRAQAEWSR